MKIHSKKGWDRQLTDDEMRQLADDPWRMFFRHGYWGPEISIVNLELAAKVCAIPKNEGGKMTVNEKEWNETVLTKIKKLQEAALLTESLRISEEHKREDALAIGHEHYEALAKEAQLRKELDALIYPEAVMRNREL